MRRYLDCGGGGQYVSEQAKNGIFACTKNRNPQGTENMHATRREGKSCAQYNNLVRVWRYFSAPETSEEDKSRLTTPRETVKTCHLLSTTSRSSHLRTLCGNFLHAGSRSSGRHHAFGRFDLMNHHLDSGKNTRKTKSNGMIGRARDRY